MRAFLFLFLCPVFAFAQKQQPHAAQIKLNLKKLNFLGSALYVAAHPDDENTRVIAWLVNDRLATTAYLSLTRGDGGQNLIGPEIRDQLGLIRTQELIAARKLDGGIQYFTRANDFGYSKSADETLTIWNKDEVLSDVVRTYRAFQPDVVITRFPPNERAGHGHHTASAMLAIEAFDLSNQPGSFPEQLKKLELWKAKRLYINTGRFFNNTIDEYTPGVLNLNVGGYNTLLGQSYSEMAADSRSQHKSQGFGVPSRRGDALEFFEPTKGDASTVDLFAGVNTTWSRVKGGEKVQPLVEEAIRKFDPERPYLTVPILLQVRKAVSQTEPGIWRTRKLAETEQLIKDCLGLYIEAAASHYWASPSQTISVTMEVINRSEIQVVVQGMSSKELAYDSVFSTPLANNAPLTFRTSQTLLADLNFSDPYWLREPHTEGLFTVKDEDLIGKPENDPAVSVRVKLSVAGELISYDAPVVYKWTDPVKGELYRPFEVVPPVFMNLSDEVMIFKDVSPRSLSILVKASQDKLSGHLSLSLPQGWRSDPERIPVSLAKKGDEVTQRFTIYPVENEITTSLTAKFSIGDKTYNHSIQTIRYDHIPIQTLLPKASARLVRVDLKKEGNVIGYIRGAGDDVPVALRNMGFEVVELKNGEINAASLSRLDAVVLGIRAFNTNERLRYAMPDLLEYVRQGGTLVVQYNTTIDLGNIYSPYPLRISRDRVSEEDAEVRILKPDHRALNYPNKITLRDFDGWVQERGLYFPGSWDEKFEALLSMNDAGEVPKNGSLLIATYGEGHYVYTGLSFFRELPEGVPGAYKLFANLVSLGKQKPAEAVKTAKPKGRTK